MKNIFLAVILCLCASNAVAQLNLSVQECRERAVATSQDIGIAELEYEQAVLDRKIARTGYLPNLSGSGTFAHLTEKMEMSMMGMPMEMNMQAVYMAGLNIQQPIFAGGKIIAGNRMATTAVEIRDENRRLVRANTIADAVQAYWTYVSVMDKVELLEQYARHLETIFNSVETSVAVQMATDNDLLKVSARKSNIEYQLQKARNGL